MQPTPPALRLKIPFVFRDLVPSDRATCTIASRVNSSDSLGYYFEVWDWDFSVSLSPASVVATNVIKTFLYEETWFSDSCAKQSRFMNYRCEFKKKNWSRPESHIRVSVSNLSIRNLCTQSLGGSFSAKRSISKEIFGSFSCAQNSRSSTLWLSSNFVGANYCNPTNFETICACIN